MLFFEQGLHANEGTLELWNSGTLELWNSGTLELWNSELPPDLLQEPPDLLQRFDHLRFLLGIVHTFLQELLRALDREAAILEEVPNDAQVGNVLLCEVAIAFAVLAWLEDVELILPKAQQRGGHTHHFGYFTDGVVESFYFFFLVRHFINE